MKQRHREWATLTAKPNKAIRRLRELPGVQELENDKLLNDRLRIDNDDRLNARIEETSIKLFGIRRMDTVFQFPPNWEAIENDDWDEADRILAQEEAHEARFYCNDEHSEVDQLAHLHERGWNLSDERGNPLRLFWWFARQVEAVAKGYMGRAPDMGAVNLQKWENSLAEEAKAAPPD
ncbi:MAG TPA: hypothetical protein VGG10_20030 [Rhizomicrobium sp.]|jgi:hypothetical protein